MTAPEMHVWFRQYAQQMGMQNTRAILPEQIDLVINTSISDTINQLIRENVGLTNDRIITDNSKIGQINAFRTLYKVKTLDIGDNEDVAPDAEGSDIGLFRSNPFIDSYTVNEDGTTTTGLIPKVNALYLIDLAINYTKDNNKVTAFYPVRLIDDAYLADTMQDFVLKPRVRTPIAVLYNNTLDLYLGENYTKANGQLSTQNLTPKQLRVSFLARPNKVRYLSDVGGTDVDCNLPESMHVDILKHAVDLYNTSIQGNLYAAQQQQQAQSREMSRNQARPDNEGYQN